MNTNQKLYIDPRLVISPKGRISDLNVVLDEGEGKYSVTFLTWDGDKSVGVRWNGTADNPMGNPQSRGIPTWFILPKEIASAFFREMLQSGKISDLKAKDIEEYLKEE